MHKFLSSILNPTATDAGRKNTCAPVSTFLQMHDKVSGMLPNANRLIALQKACEDILPEHFAACDVLQMEKALLTIGAPSQAAAARLRQKLPQLKSGLEKTGWSLDSIRIKVRLKRQNRPKETPQKKTLPSEAVLELEKLEAWLTQSGTHPALEKAVRTMMERHQKEKK